MNTAQRQMDSKPWMPGYFVSELGYCYSLTNFALRQEEARAGMEAMALIDRIMEVPGGRHG